MQQSHTERDMAPRIAPWSLRCERELWNNTCLRCKTGQPKKESVVCKTCKENFQAAEGERWKDSYYLQGGFHFCRIPGCWTHTMQRGSNMCHKHSDVKAERLLSPSNAVKAEPAPTNAVKAEPAPSPSRGYSGYRGAARSRSRTAKSARSGSWYSRSRSSSPSIAQITTMRPACNHKKVHQWIRRTCTDDQLAELIGVCAAEVSHRFNAK